MTTRTTTIGQGKQGFRGVLVLTTATAALLGGVLLWQVRPTSDEIAGTTANHSQVGNGLTQVREPESRYHEAARVQRIGVEASPPRGGMAELYAELQAGAGTVPATSVAVDTMGGMAELYRDQRAAADQQRTRVECGDGLQPALCY